MSDKLLKSFQSVPAAQSYSFQPVFSECHCIHNYSTERCCDDHYYYCELLPLLCDLWDTGEAEIDMQNIK